MISYRLLQAADNDLEEIADYTIKKYGAVQASAYYDRLLSAFETIASNPGIGTDQSHILPTLRRLIHEAHSIYYRMGDDEIVVMRLLGPGQDPLTQLQLT